MPPGIPSFRTLLLDTDGAIATVTLNRPDALNAIDVAMAQDPQRAAQWIEARDEIRASLTSGLSMQPIQLDTGGTTN